MPSQLANRIAHAVLAVDADQPSSAVAIDKELQEVLETMAHLLSVIKGANLPSCPKCQRARVLMETLKCR